MRLGSKGCWRIGRSIAKLWLALPLAILPCAHADESPQNEGTTVHITRAELLSVTGTGYSLPPQHIEAGTLPSEGWKPVDLPYTASRELVPTASSGMRAVTDWYRIDLSGQPPTTQQRVLYLPRWKTLGHIAVYGDGVLSTSRTAAPSTTATTIRCCCR